MRIGTWNLEGRWTPGHSDFLAALDCDVLLLTEVSERLVADEYAVHLGAALMAPGRRWAAVLTRDALVPRPDPHHASAMAVSGSVTYCSSILPWRGAKGRPWTGESHAERTQHALAELLTNVPATDLIWGGDWNHALHDRETAGSKVGRVHLRSALDTLRLDVPTEHLPHQIEGILSIDHVAVPRDSEVTSAVRVSAIQAEGRLSDHDASVVTLG